MMAKISQRDVRWAEKPIGASSLTIGRYGCCLTSISMLSDFFKCFISPLDIAGHKDWFTPQGLVIWNKLGFSRMNFVWRSYGRDDVKIKAALKGPNTAVLLQVANGSHWVVGIRPTLLGKSFIVADPWLGDTCDVIKRYGNITGAAYFQGKP